MVEALESKAPIVVSGSVNKDTSIFIATNQKAVTKGNVDVHDIEVFRREAINGLALCCFWNSGEGTKRKWKLAIVNKGSIAGGGIEMLVVAEPSASCDAMKSSAVQ